LVEGTLKIGGKTLQISSAPAKGETTPRWLAYGDGNWGHEVSLCCFCFLLLLFLLLLLLLMFLLAAAIIVYMLFVCFCQSPPLTLFTTANNHHTTTISFRTVRRRRPRPAARLRTTLSARRSRGAGTLRIRRSTMWQSSPASV
jgi:hypothetical protein